MIFFILSALVINLTHTFLLISQDSKKGLTLSEHAVRDRKTHAMYIIGHFLGGLLFLMFARDFFVITHNNNLLFVITFIGVITEWLQALVPARHKYEKIHIILAVLMSVFMVLIGTLGALLLPVDELVKNIILFISFVMCLGYPGAVWFPRKYFWIIEMVNINLFYLQILLLVLVS